MKHKRLWGVLLASAALAATLAPAAHASAEGRRNTTAILGAVAAYELLRGHTTTGVIAGAAAVGAYSRYRDARDDDRYDGRYRRRAYRDDDRYRPRYRDYDRVDYRYRDGRYRDDRYRDGRYRDGRDDYRYRDAGRTPYYLDDRDRDCDRR